MKIFGILLVSAVVSGLFMGSVQASTTPSLVVDVNTNEVLFADQAGATWYPASVTKLMTAYVTFKQIKANQISLTTKVPFSKNALTQEDVRSRMSVGNQLTLEDALAAMLAISANDAAVAIAEKVGGDDEKFVGMMNSAAKGLGMTATHYENPNGLHHPRHVSSARDLAILAIAINKEFPQYMKFFNISKLYMENGSKNWSYNSKYKMLTRYPGSMGMKTGFVCASGRNAISMANRNGRKVVVVILGASTMRERDERAAKLSSEAFSGELKSTPAKQLVGQIKNTQTAAVDMRKMLCTGNSNKYVLMQEKLYPMGLPGRKSYFSEAATQVQYHARILPAAKIAKPTAVANAKTKVKAQAETQQASLARK